VTTFPPVNDGLTDRVPTLRNFETLGGGVHCEFLNIDGQIENHSKLQGGDPYFSLYNKYSLKHVKWVMSD
jgi:hypothetical protein